MSCSERKRHLWKWPADASLLLNHCQNSKDTMWLLTLCRTSYFTWFLLLSLFFVFHCCSIFITWSALHNSMKAVLHPDMHFHIFISCTNIIILLHVVFSSNRYINILVLFKNTKGSISTFFSLHSSQGSKGWSISHHFDECFNILTSEMKLNNYFETTLYC